MQHHAVTASGQPVGAETLLRTMAPVYWPDLVRQVGQADAEHLAAILAALPFDAEFRVADAAVRTGITQASASKLVQRLLTAGVVEQTRTAGKSVYYRLATQILGQLSERLSYERLYQEALSDPELKRTELELEAALENASEAREVVFELFQDLDRFSLEDYLPYADTGQAMDRLQHFLALALAEQGRRLVPVEPKVLEIRDGEERLFGRIATDREHARATEGLELLGLDHPLVQAELARWRGLPPEEVGTAVAAPVNVAPGVLSWWLVDVSGENGAKRSHVVGVGVGLDGERQPALERQAAALLGQAPRGSGLTIAGRERLLHEAVEPVLHRELRHRGLVSNERGGFGATLVGWVEVT